MTGTQRWERDRTPMSGIATATDVEDQEAAVRAVLWRRDNAGLSPQDAATVLDVLGLREVAEDMRAGGGS